MTAPAGVGEHAYPLAVDRLVDRQDSTCDQSRQFGVEPVGKVRPVRRER